MCGLTGFLTSPNHLSANRMQEIVGTMAETLHHRGPDDQGTWCDPAAGVALGFRRLSIVDLSPCGRQPMTSSCGRFIIAFNGEIYNHDELRAELTTCGRTFRGRSDTEVLLEGIAAWGIRPTIERSVGMFAIALWDTQSGELTLIRDRLGKKPLYYGRFPQRPTPRIADSPTATTAETSAQPAGFSILFGSELKALRAHPDFQASVNREALNEFLRQSYLSNQSIYEGVIPLPPGTLLTLRPDRDTLPSATLPAPTPYWDFRQVRSQGQSHPFTGSYAEAVDKLDELLTDAVQRRMVADVPLGAFLSGGIDSSLVVALMQKCSSRPIKTFTIGFDVESYNEAPYAAAVARHLKTDHTQMMVSSTEARDVIPLLPKLYDEPFGDSSEIPTYLVSRLARQHVTVALTGDGGDELFCGYRRYFEALDDFSAQSSGSRSRAARIAERLRKLPPGVRKSLSRTGRVAASLSWGRVQRLLSRTVDVLSETGPHDRYLRNMSHWRDADGAVRGISRQVPSPSSRSIIRDEPDNPPFPAESPAQLQQDWQAYDTLTYLPGDILTKVDRASMGVSLEARTPLLDHRVVEFAWTLPHEFKVQAGQGKRILRDVLAKYVPRELFERPKVGFGVPIADWLRGPLRDWVEKLINEPRLSEEGFLNPRVIRERWQDHLRGADWSYLLWDVLMFQAWLDEYSHR